MNILKLVKKLFILFIFCLFFLLFNSVISYAEKTNYIYVQQNYTLKDITYNLEQYNDVQFFDKENNIIDDLTYICKTGIKVVCSSNNMDSTLSYQLVVKGDVNGDGKVDKDDVYQIKLNLVGLNTIENEFEKACDKNEDNSISLYDLFHNNQSLKKDLTENDEEIEIEISDIQLNADSLDLQIGEKYNLTASILPENATHPEVNFFSTNSDVADIDEKGEITAINNGTTQIIATCSNGVSAICKVNVYTLPTKLTLNQENVILFINGTSSYNLIAKVTPDSSNVMTDITWESSNSNVVSVDEKGNIKATGNGSAIITARNQNDLQASCNVTVYTMPSNIQIPEELSIEQGLTYKIDAIITPEDCNYNTDISWYSDFEDIVTVSDTGIIEAKHPGKAIITARTPNGIESKCSVTIYKNIKDIIFSTNSTTIDLSNNNTYQILANSETGEDITNMINWESSDEKIATVTNTGRIEAHSNGKVIIKGSFNNIEELFELTVNTTPKVLTLKDSLISLGVNEEKILEYTITPNNTNIYNTITWSSSNSNIVSVDNTGKIQAVSPGKAIIKAQCGINNNIFSTCNVIITSDPNKMSFEQNKLLIKENETKTVLLSFDKTLEEIDLNDLVITCDTDTNISYEYIAESNESKSIIVSITGLKEGLSTIIATIDDLSTRCEVVTYSTISSLDLYVENLKLNNETVSLDVAPNNSLVNITAKLNGIYNISSLVEWESSNKTKANIDNKGTIHPNETGTIQIYAKLEDLSASFTLIIEKLPQAITMCNSINLYINDTTSAKLQPVITPFDSTNKNIKYISSNEEVATISEDGMISAKNAGTTVITATTVNNISTKCTVTVKIAPSQISFNNDTIYLKKGGKSILNTTILPANTNAYNTLTWSSDNSNIVSVDGNGNITANNSGIANITVKTANGKTDTIQVIVPNLSVKALADKLDVSVSNKKETTIVNNNSTNIGNLSYQSSNTNIATVDNNGKITAKTNGTVQITVTESNAATSVTIPITITTSTTSITLNQTNVSLDINNTSYQLIATQNPSTVTTKGVSWTSSNSNVVTVNNGIITRVGTGTATITVKAIDGSNISATCNVVVKREKMIIVGASTICQLAAQRKCSTTAGDRWQPNYYSLYGYKVRVDSTYYDYLDSKYKATTDQDADLFFVCKGGSGYYWLSGESNLSDVYDKTGPAGEAQTRIKQILAANSNNNSHFTIAFLQGGNDLIKPTKEAQVKSIANKYAKYYKSFADSYPQANVYIFPVTPVDATNASDELNKTGYNISNSNNTKRYEFACSLNSYVSAYNSSNLKYAKGFYNDLKSYEKNNTPYTTFNGKVLNNVYVAYDGKHFNKNTARLVLEKMFTYCKVVGANGKKK